MVVYACEPRGGVWQKYSPFFRGFCVWLYRDFVSRSIFGWEYAFSILRAIFPEESQPDEATIVGWYKGNPDYPEKLSLIGSPQPVEYLQEWFTSHPDETREFRALALLKTKTESQSGRLRPQEYSSQSNETAVPIYFPQRQLSTFSNNLIEQLTGIMCQAIFLAMVGWFARQYAKIAMS